MEDLIAGLADAFDSPEDHARARQQWLAGLLNLGRHTVTGALTTAGGAQRDWSADYRLLQRLPVDKIFAHLQQETLRRTTGPWVVAVDDSITRKTGRKIPGCGWRRDPLSPPFHVNFTWGQRVLQFSAALPAGDGSARLVPVDWTEAPLPAKPGRKATAEEQSAYQEARRQANLNQVAVGRLQRLQQATTRPIHLVTDGRFTNRTLLRQLPAGTVLIGRIRKDTKLYARPEARNPIGRPRQYGAELPTPEAMRVADTPWTTVSGHATGQTHDFKIKHTGAVLARIRGVDAPVRVIVLAPLGYRLRAGSKLLYRQPAFLLVTDPDLPVQTAVQEYLWRWDIEVNFHDEKSLLGVSEAQLRQPEAVRRQPAGIVAAYSLLLLAAFDAYGATGRPPSVPLPKWRRRRPPPRASTSLLLSQLRVETWTQCLRRDTLSHFSSRPPPDQKSPNLSSSLASAVFLAHR